jgi:hypothetical protein
MTPAQYARIARRQNRRPITSEPGYWERARVSEIRALIAEKEGALVFIRTLPHGAPGIALVESEIGSLREELAALVAKGF